MPPDRGRASKACTACRKQKTRCYESANGAACLRCERLGQSCSLCLSTPSQRPCVEVAWTGHNGDQGQHSNDARIRELETTVRSLSRRLDDLESERVCLESAGLDNSSASSHLEATYSGREIRGSEQAAAPLVVLRDAAAQSGLQPVIREAAIAPSQILSGDIIFKGLIAEHDALYLTDLFQKHYGRWVHFDFSSTPSLLEQLRKSPLLLCACCLVALRHTTHSLSSEFIPKLLKAAKEELSVALLNVPQRLDFFQATLVLSMWSTTIAQVPMAFDSWLIGGFALQHSNASEIFDFNLSSYRPTLNKTELDYLCIWNHLCLVHLHYCVGTRRKALLSRNDIERCRLVLGTERATNFEARMVSEVYLYWIIYETCSSAIELPRAQTSLHAWKQEWKWLFEQPRSQFVQMGFYFAQLLIYDQSVKSRSAAVRESLLAEMVRLSTSIINLAMETSDERIGYLSDHIYHMISFAAVTLCRLLHTHQDQLSSTHDLHGLDGLILALVSWLHAIGLPCHVAHTMGDVVAAFHKRLRPDPGPSPSTSYAEVDPGIQEDFAQLFPELFGIPFDINNATMLPDFQPIS